MLKARLNRIINQFHSCEDFEIKKALNPWRYYERCKKIIDREDLSSEEYSGWIEYVKDNLEI